MRIVSAREHLASDRYTFHHHEGASMVTAHDQRIIIGYLTWWEPHMVMAAVETPRPAPYELQRVEVRPEYQRLGVASQLMAFAQEHAPVRFSRRMTSAGQGWAASLGYHPDRVYQVPDLGGEGLWNA